MRLSTNQQVRSLPLVPFLEDNTVLVEPEPTEDTFILLDALEAEADVIRSLAPRVCLEIG